MSDRRTPDPHRSEVSPISTLPRSAPTHGAVANGLNPFTDWLTEPSVDQQDAIYAVVRMARALAECLLRQVPGSPERTLAMRDLERCVMQAERAIKMSGGK